MAFNPFKWLLGLFSLDIGIDLGTANTLVYVKGKGIIINEPSWVAIEKRTRRPMAVGQEARNMLGRAPASINVIRPLRDGVIAEFEITEAMLEYFFSKVHEQTVAPLPSPRAVIAGWLKQRGVTEVVEDSSGNAGASLAAYAGKFGLRARIFVPAAASGVKRRQIEAYGADLVPVPGSRADVSEAVRREAERGAVYASHAWLPFNLPGYATTAYEIWEQLGGRLPGAVIVPAGQGGLLLGLARGFDALRVANMGKERAEKEDAGKKRAQGEKPETETKKARKDKLLKGICNYFDNVIFSYSCHCEERFLRRSNLLASQETASLCSQ